LVAELEPGHALVRGDDGTEELLNLVKEKGGERAESRRRSPSIAGRIDLDSLRAAPHVIVAMYGEWCDRLARYAKDAISCGVLERAQLLVEHPASPVGAVWAGVLTDPRLGLAPEARAL